MSNIFAVLFILFLAVGCSTAPPTRPVAPAMCDGQSAKKSIKLYVLSSTKPPTGLPLDTARARVEMLTDVADTFTSSLLPLLAWSSIDDGGNLARDRLTAKRWFRQTSKPLKDAAIECSEGNCESRAWAGGRLRNEYRYESHVVLTRLEPPTFVVCEMKQCEGLVDPLSGLTIEADKPVSLSWYTQRDYLSEAARGFHHHRVNGLPWQNSVTASLGGRSEWNGASTDAPSAIELANKLSTNDLGSYTGTYSRLRYISVPEDKKEQVCKGIAKLDGDKLKGCMSTVEELTKSGMSLEEAIASLNEYWMSIFFGLNTKQTRKVAGAWIIREVDFDPTPLCKYSRPRSELFSD